MSTQLTISIELIALMEWVLKNKSDLFMEFINNVIDEPLRAKLITVTTNKEVELESADLYITLNNFIGFMEKHIQHSIGIPQQSQEELGKTCRRRSSTHQYHSARCTRKSKFNEAETIKSPTQRLLYKALAGDESNSESTIH